MKIVVRLLSTFALVLAVACTLAEERQVLGKLGQSTTETDIHQKMSKSSRLYFHVKAFEYLVIQSTDNDRWFRVLLKNGMFGYVSADDVVKLPYDVTAPKSPSRSSGQINSRTGTSLARYSLNFVGTPYKWGGNDLSGGIDCSAFVKKMYGAIGVNLPRTAAEQVNVGTPVNRLQDLQAGDRLYFWDSKRGKVGHTGICNFSSTMKAR